MADAMEPFGQELSLKSENFSDLRISVSALYLLAAPSTPSEAVDEVIERAKSPSGDFIKDCIAFAT